MGGWWGGGAVGWRGRAVGWRGSGGRGTVASWGGTTGLHPPTNVGTNYGTVRNSKLTWSSLSPTLKWCRSMVWYRAKTPRHCSFTRACCASETGTRTSPPVAAASPLAKLTYSVLYARARDKGQSLPRHVQWLIADVMFDARYASSWPTCRSLCTSRSASVPLCNAAPRRAMAPARHASFSSLAFSNASFCCSCR